MLDNPTIATQEGPASIDSVTAQQWKDGVEKSVLDTYWESIGGLTNTLEDDVVYKQVLIPGEKTQPITDTKPVKCELYFKDGVLGYTENHPRYFYVEGQ